MIVSGQRSLFVRVILDWQVVPCVAGLSRLSSKISAFNAVCIASNARAILPIAPWAVAESDKPWARSPHEVVSPKILPQLPAWHSRY